MYHIKKDKRVYQSANLICQGLAESLQEKSYEDISISQVCQATGVSRATFYRLFDTLDDVLLYQFDQLFEETIHRHRQEGQEAPSYAQLILQLATSNKNLTTAIIDSGRYDIFSLASHKVEQEFTQVLGLDMTYQDFRYTTAMLDQLLFAALSIWAKSGYHENAEQLYKLLKKNLLLITEHL